MASTGSSGIQWVCPLAFQNSMGKMCKTKSAQTESNIFLTKLQIPEMFDQFDWGFPYFPPPLRFFSVKFITMTIFWMKKFAPPKGIRAKVMYILTFPCSMVQGFRGSGILCLKIPVLLGICKQRGPRILRMDSQGDCKALEFLKICQASEVS